MKLDEQLSSFDVSNAECFAPEDRAEILEKIKGMYAGGLEEFNDAVRNELRDDVLRAVRHTPYTLLPYTTLMTGIVAAVGFMYFGISWFRSTNTATFVSFSIYMVTFSSAMMPFVAAFSLRQGEALYKRRPPPDGETNLVQALKRNKWQYLKIGLEGAGIFILLWTSLAFVLPLATINAEEQPFLGLFPKDSAIVISLVTCIPAFPAAFWTFRRAGRRGNGNRVEVEGGEEEEEII